ncbi:MAG: hypothetical protein IJB79_01215 [Candidatus Gastranaerophilales bacterium]|nr:hypothetical protein [Candidatus Gastranaerophilales bacterium]
MNIAFSSVNFKNNYSKINFKGAQAHENPNAPATKNDINNVLQEIAQLKAEMNKYFMTLGAQTTFDYSQVKLDKNKKFKNLEGKLLTGTVISQKTNGTKIAQDYYMGRLSETRTYDDKGGIKTTSTRLYDPKQRLIKIETKDSSGKIIQTKEYFYESADSSKYNKVYTKSANGLLKAVELINEDDERKTHLSFYDNGNIKSYKSDKNFRYKANNIGNWCGAQLSTKDILKFSCVPYEVSFWENGTPKKEEINFYSHYYYGYSLYYDYHQATKSYKQNGELEEIILYPNIDNKEEAFVPLDDSSGKLKPCRIPKEIQEYIDYNKEIMAKLNS